MKHSPWTSAQWMTRVVKPAIFILSLIPAAALGWRGYAGNLGADPIAESLNEFGIWTLRFVLVTLCITPLRRLTGFSPLILLRRMIGLFAFFYGSLHFLTYVAVDQALDVHDIIADIAKRPFITVGFASFVLMIPLAVTSTKKMIRRLGGRRWNLLHRLIYLTACGGVIHYYWRVKADTRPPLLYGAVLLMLFAIRIWYQYRSKSLQPAKIVLRETEKIKNPVA